MKDPGDDKWIQGIIMNPGSIDINPGTLTVELGII